MPADFLKCIRQGGKVRTIKKGNNCTPLCFIGGKSFAGETKKCKR